VLSVCVASATTPRPLGQPGGVSSDLTSDGSGSRPDGPPRLGWGGRFHARTEWPTTRLICADCPGCPTPTLPDHES
jgi:hypothetical protein